MTFAIKQNGDLDLSGNRLNKADTEKDAIAYHIQTRLNFVLGEWFLNTRLGLPYFERILVKNPDLDQIANIFKEAILRTAGVKSLQSFSLNLDNTTRTLYITFSALIDTTGELLDYSHEIRIEGGSP